MDYILQLGTAIFSPYIKSLIYIGKVMAITSFLKWAGNSSSQLQNTIQIRILLFGCLRIVALTRSQIRVHRGFRGSQNIYSILKVFPKNVLYNRREPHVLSSLHIWLHRSGVMDGRGYSVELGTLLCAAAQIRLRALLFLYRTFVSCPLSFSTSKRCQTLTLGDPTS